MSMISKSIYILLCAPLFFINCSKKGANYFEDIEGVIATSKYCYNYYSEEKKEGINIYFAGRIINNTIDTIYILDKDLSKNSKFELKESLFYTIINNDTLYFDKWFTPNLIMPNSFILIELQRHILPNETKWINAFKDITMDQTILDTLRIHYAIINLRDTNILPPIMFKHSLKFRIDTVPYNSYIEGIFDISDYYDDFVDLVPSDL